MKQAVLLVFVFVCCLSFKEGSSKESCPNAKNSIENDKVEFVCRSETQDPCYRNIQKDKDFLVEFQIAVPEEVESVWYDVSIIGDGINATSSGKVPPVYVDREYNTVYVDAEMKGDMVLGYGTATVNLYYNEQKKDIPDWCARTTVAIFKGL